MALICARRAFAHPSLAHMIAAYTLPVKQAHGPSAHGFRIHQRDGKVMQDMGQYLPTRAAGAIAGPSTPSLATSSSLPVIDERRLASPGAAYSRSPLAGTPSGRGTGTPASSLPSGTHAEAGLWSVSACAGL